MPNDGWTYREVVTPAHDGAPALAYLAGRYRHSDETVWRDRLARGEVRVDGEVAGPDTALRAGCVLLWTRPPWDEPDVPLSFAVVHRDADLLVVDKPRGLPTLPNGGFLAHTLLHLVRRAHPEAVPMHRLGRGTSGLVLFTRSIAARRAVAAAWRRGAVDRDYRGLVAGVPAWDARTVDTAIGPVPHPRLGSVHAASPDGVPAVSHVRVVARRAGTSLVDVRIETGRPHQIRIHLAAAGHPLAGDPLYVAGGVPAADPALPGDGGYLLHARRLALVHPATRRSVAFEAPLPDARLRNDG